MGVRVKTYVVFGTVLPYSWWQERTDAERTRLEAYFDDDLREVRDGITVLVDGMNGKYVVAGKVFNKTKFDQPFDEPIQLYVLPDNMESILTGINHVIGEHFRHYTWIIVPHYS